MTTIEQLPEVTDRGVDELPIGHLPDNESMAALMRGERATRALCGAEILGILATPPFKRCETCYEILARMHGWTPN